MNVYYDDNAEALYTVGEISYSELNKNSNLPTQHFFSVRVKIEYKDNPKTSPTQTQKETSKEIDRKYDAKTDSRENAQSFFEAEIVRAIGGGKVRKVSPAEETIIRDEW